MLSVFRIGDTRLLPNAAPYRSNMALTSRLIPRMLPLFVRGSIGCLSLFALGLAGSANPLSGNAAGRSAPLPATSEPMLTAADVDAAVQQAATAVAGESFSVAVVDRAGTLLAVWHRAGAGDGEDQLALSLARTGAFFGNDQSPLTSRTVRTLSSIHFPPGTHNAASGPLYGIENTNRVDRHVNYLLGQEYPDPLNVDGTGPSLGITTGKVDVMDSDPHAVNPGGVPVFKDGKVAGGIGIAGVPGAQAEFAAAKGGNYPHIPPGKAILLQGVALPLVVNRNRPPHTTPGTFPGTGSYRMGPNAGGLAADGWLSGPTASTELSVAEVTALINASVDVASRTRAAIRLPLGARSRMVIAVGDLAGNILGLYRMPDATVFSLDVSVAKARNVVYFSGPNRLPSELPGLPVGTAVTNRSISFAAQPLFPSGIERSQPGPFFPLFQFDFANPGTQGMQPANGLQNGIVFFPGSVPLYRNGQLVGGLGVSGDGVEQDDFVAYYGSAGYYPPPQIRADQFKIRGVRIPYLKFPRNPLD